MASLTLHIEGMTCGHCLNAVGKALASVPGLIVRTVAIGRADVEFESDAVSVDQIVAAVSDAGYPATASAG
jgi:copper chaperone CopZ